MGRIKTTEQSGTSENRVIVVKISDLRITHEKKAVWLKQWIKENGDAVKDSPQYLYLCGDYEPVQAWCKYMRLPPTYFSQKIMMVLKSIIYEGQKEPIKIYKDMRINTGHKRSACLLYLGEKFIRAVVVPDNYKL